MFGDDVRRVVKAARRTERRWIGGGFWVSEGFGCGFGVLNAKPCSRVSGHRRNYWGLCFYVPHSPPNTEAEVRRCDRFGDMEGQS